MSGTIIGFIAAIVIIGLVATGGVAEVGHAFHAGIEWIESIGD